MKIAISGKGGVGKTTIASILALMLAERGDTVLALDADPDANLASSLGIPEADQAGIVSIGQQMDLVEERMGAKPGTYGQMFNLDPKVSDLADKYGYTHRGVSLLVLGAIRSGGGGCACPENAFLKALVDDLVLNKNETLLMDMEAGLEHLGRGTAEGVDVLVVVVEPGHRSMDCARDIERLASEIGLDHLIFVGNKIITADDEAYIRQELEGRNIAALLPMSESLRMADRDGRCPYDVLTAEERAQYEALLAAIEEAAR